MVYAIKLHQWVLSLNDMYSRKLISRKVYLDSLNSVEHIAELIGEKEHLERLMDEHYGV